MLSPDVVDKMPIGLAELKDELTKIQARDEELGFRSGKTLEYVNSFGTLSLADFIKLKDEVSKLDIPRLKDEHVVKIVDFLPKSVADLDVLLQGYPITITKENQKKIVDVVKAFMPSKS